MVLKFERLPKTVIPVHYNLHLKPDLVECVFEGLVAIDLEVKESVAEITLNSVDLELQHVEVEQSDGSVLLPSQVSVSVDEETAKLSFASPLLQGKAKLSITFKGELRDSLQGFYRSKYLSVDGKEKYAAVTQFESTKARRCFPCWDEPAIKSTFNISLTVPTDRVALSNMPVASTEDLKDGLRLVKFEKTPIMSTYLVAVVIGEYDYIEDTSSDGVVVRVYTPVGKRELGRFALEVAVAVLPYYKDYFQIAYPLPKLDLITVADFSAAGMENWGLIIYREYCLLVDPEWTSTKNKQWIALVVSHEVAHQWFGNLVTMEWWTHLWLNEGYATFAQFLSLAEIFPEYNLWLQFVTDTHTRALDLDALDSSHPIEVSVGHPVEIGEIFDAISYSKSAAVIRMLHRYIGDEDFRKGMHLYLTRHQYGNTRTEDLWAALSETSNKPVADVMNTWTKQVGFPVIRVESKHDGHTRSIVVTQEKFCADGTSNATSTQQWLVPLQFSTSKSPSEPVHTFVLDSKTGQVTLSGLSESDWVKLNPGTVGFYRTNYPADMLSRFVPAIINKTLPPLDRLGILDDLLALVQSGQESTASVLRLLPSFAEEDNYTVWSCVNRCLVKVELLLQYSDQLEAFHKFARRLVAPAAAKLGWDAQPQESHMQKLLRTLLVVKLVSCGDPETLEEAKKRFQAHLSGESPIPADLRSAVYNAVLSSADDATFETFLKLYREEKLLEEKDRIAFSLGAVRDDGLQKRVLDFAISDEVRSQDSISVMTSVARSKQGRELAWAFCRNHFPMLYERYKGSILIGRLVKSTTGGFASEEAAKEVESFFAENNAPGTERSVQQAVENIRVNAAWLKRDEESIRAYLSEIANGNGLSVLPTLQSFMQSSNPIRTQLARYRFLKQQADLISIT